MSEVNVCSQPVEVSKKKNVNKKIKMTYQIIKKLIVCVFINLEMVVMPKRMLFGNKV